MGSINDHITTALGGTGAVNDKLIAFFSGISGGTTGQVLARRSDGTIGLQDNLAISATANGLSTANSGAANLAALQALLTSLQSTGGRVRIPSGTYTIGGSTDLTYTSSKDIFIEFDPEAELDFRTSTANIALNISGALISSFSLTADAVVNTNTVTVPEATASAIVGDGRDVLKIIPGDGRGELVEVRSGSGTTATLQSFLLDTYVAGATVEHYRMPRVLLTNPRIRRATGSATSAIGLRYCRRAVIEEGYIYGARYIGVYGFNCVDFAAYNVEVDNEGSTGGEATNYGFGLGPGQKFLLDNCKAYGAKHALSASGNEPAWLVEARSSIFDTPRVDATTFAVRSHSSTQHLRMTDCEVRCGLSHVGKNVTIRGGSYSGLASAAISAISITPQVAAVDFIDIDGVLIPAGDFGLLVFPQAGNTTVERFAWRNSRSLVKNRITSVSARILTIEDAAITNNICESGSYPLEIVDGTGTVVIERLMVSGSYKHTSGSTGKLVTLATAPLLRDERGARFVTGSSTSTALPQSDITNLTTDLAGKMTKVSGRQETRDDRGTTSGTVTLNLGAGNYFTVTASGDVTFAFGQIPASPIVATIQIEMTENGVGGWTWTFPASVKWEGGAAPVWNTAASAKNLARLLTRDGGTTWLGVGFVGIA